MQNEDGSLQRIKDLVENFRKNEGDYCRRDSQYNEAQLRSDFIDPFFKELGWDIYNTAALPQHLREVVHEARVDSSTSWKKPDYAFRLASVRKFFVETKKPSIDVERDSESAFQLRRYGWSAKLPISVLTNFKYLIVYDCRPPPHENDNYRTCRLKVYSYTEYETKYKEIYELLSREAVYTGEFDKRFAEVVIKGSNPIDDYFLTQIDRWRKRLAIDILTENPDLKEEELNYLVEAFINRIVFLRICEDREIEKYGTLLNIASVDTKTRLLEAFKKADSKYNSGIFDFRKDRLSLGVAISDETLVQIIKDIYYPRSPYVFSVVESNILGQIYELFLTKRISISKNKKVEVLTKPEVSHDLGVITTPRFIVQEIAGRTIKPLCEGQDPEKISRMRFADIACGSGSFLLEVYDYLLDYHLNWYIEHQPSDKIYRGEGDYWYLTLEEKKRILLNNIFGVDVDPNAVEVTKFSLLIRLIEDETANTIDAAIHRLGESALPTLDDNIKCGNSLVDKSFFGFKKASELSSEELVRLNVFDWKQAFPFIKNGFSAIIGNPPYTRIQVMKRLFPQELEYYQRYYESAQSNNFDKYYVFIERALSLVGRDSLVGFIVPHKFMKIKAGRALRGLITKENHLQELVHFGKEQVFEGSTTTYTCLLTLNKSGVSQFRADLVRNLHEWKYYPDNRTTIVVDASEISSAPWLFIVGPLKQLVKRILSLPRKLSDVADVYVGLQTSMDKIYVVRPLSIRGDKVTFRDIKGKLWTIEKSILQHAIYDLEISPFMTPRFNSLIVFPYRLKKGQILPYSESEMRRKYPLTLRYLRFHKKLLLKRDIGNPEPDKWFKYGRSQSLTKFDGREKLIVKVLSLEPCFTYDNANLHFTGGGNGPYYGVCLKPGQTYSIFFLQGILNSKLTDLFVKNWSSVFRAGYYSYGKQFIEKLPVVDIDVNKHSDRVMHERIVRTVRKLMELSSSLERARIPSKKEQVKSQITVLKDELNESVYELYGLTEEEKQYVRNLDLS